MLLKFNRSSSIRTFNFLGFRYNRPIMVLILLCTVVPCINIYLFRNFIFLTVPQWNYVSRTTCIIFERLYKKYIFMLLLITYRFIAFLFLYLYRYVWKLSLSEIVRVNNVHTVFVRNEKIIITFSRKSRYSMTLKQIFL